MKKLTHFIMAMLLTTLLVACQSSKVIEVEKLYVPTLDFPIFPKDSKMVNNHDGTVTVSAEWIVRLEEYRIRIEATQKDYELLKELYDN